MRRGGGLGIPALKIGKQINTAADLVRRRIDQRCTAWHPRLKRGAPLCEEIRNVSPADKVLVLEPEQMAREGFQRVDPPL